ncbi:MAG: abortive infection family protein [Candidatus Omnitrophica bacterium]|nr:abortive infection family protein [Candidatus Omnitrophota bacterium]
MVRENFFSKRESKEKKVKLLYDLIPSSTRNSIIMIMSEYPERWETTETGFNYQISTLKLLEREILKNEGWNSLKAYDEQNRFVEVSIEEFLRRCRYDHFLDAIEFLVDILYEEETLSFIEEVNTCFRRDNLGYQLLPDGRIIKFTSGYLHQEVVKEAFSLLNGFGFEGALEEFEKAIISFRKRDLSTAIHNANNAFESTLKAITGIKEGDANKLIKRLIKNQLIPNYYVGFIESFTKILHGLPITRNKMGGHGQGGKKRKIDESYAELAIHLAGTLIVFLIKRYQEIQKLDSKIPF